LSAEPLIACPDCDLLQREIALPRGGRAMCGRCGLTLYRSARGGLHHIVALTITATILFFIANALPIASLDLGAKFSETTLMGSVIAVAEQEQWIVAGMILWTAVLAPGAELLALCYMLIPLWLGHCPRYLSLAFRVALAARAWALVDVFMLGVAVALIKLGDLADVIPGPALLAFGGLIVSLTAVSAMFDPREVWLHAEACRTGRFPAEATQ
jgi:paraquat-inducible protein A